MKSNTELVDNWRKKKGHNIYYEKYRKLRILDIPYGLASKMRHWSEERIKEYLADNGYSIKVYENL